jgi:hypothetical protein
VKQNCTSFPLSKHTGGCDTAPTFSGWRVYLQLTWEGGLLLSPVEFSSHHHFYKLSHSWLLGVCCCSCQPTCLFTAHVGSGSSPLSCGVFLPLPLSQSFPAPGCWVHVQPSLARPSWFIYSSRRDSPPLRAPHPLCYVSLLFLFLITQFLFFPRVGVGLSRGLCWSGPGMSVGVLHTT